MKSLLCKTSFKKYILKDIIYVPENLFWKSCYEIMSFILKNLFWKFCSINLILVWKKKNMFCNFINFKKSVLKKFLEQIIYDKIVILKILKTHVQLQ